MLTEFITRRFAKHHAQVLAYMDALEEAVRHISDSPNPRDEFDGYRRLLKEFLDFSEARQLPHEREEEKLLLPVLERKLKEATDPRSATTMARVCREHDTGRRLTEKVREGFGELDRLRPADASPYYDLTATLTDLIWHFRRHIWEEDSIILPTAERLIPPSDPIWVPAERPRKGSGARAADASRTASGD